MTFRAGRWVIMVLAPKREARTIAGDILSVHGAEFVGFYGRWAWEGLTKQRPGSRRRRDGSARLLMNGPWPVVTGHMARLFAPNRAISP